jgi:acyl-CoA reductase-like NAD-dependent aldehyde dehydrogenase
LQSDAVDVTVVREGAAKSACAGIASQLRRARAAQELWADVSVRSRLAVVRRLRGLLAARDEALIAAAHRPGRPSAEVLASEIVPLADACRFLERRAERLLAPRRLGRRGRPMWLLGTDAEVRREPLGVVQILAPGNYPLFLPGVQLLQALVAGNGVLLKPAPDCGAAMVALCDLLDAAGLPEDLVQLLNEEPDQARLAMASVDKVILTGSAETGRRVLADLAPHLVPTTLELSGSDAVFVLPGADLVMVAEALAFGLRLNGGATCIAPRRAFVPKEDLAKIETLLCPLLATMPVVTVGAATCRRILALRREASRQGCRIIGPRLAPETGRMAPLVVIGASHELALLREDIFAPVLTIMPVSDLEEAIRLDRLCPYALGASVFGPEAAARALAARIRAGAVTINDVIVPTADPRLPFGGRDASGYGITRGAEGLLELTVAKTVSTRRGRLRPHYAPPVADDDALFRHYLRAVHGGSWSGRIRSWLALGAALLHRLRAQDKASAGAAARGQREPK